MQNLSLSFIISILFGFAFSMSVTAQEKPNSETLNVCSPRPVEALYITLESEEPRFCIKSSGDRASLKIKVVNCSGDPIDVLARPRVELLRVGSTKQSALIRDWFRGSVEREYAPDGSSIRLDTDGRYEFEIDLNRMKYKPRKSSINVWEPFLEIIPSGEFNVTGIIILAKLDSNGYEVLNFSKNQVTVESVNDSLK